MMTELSLVPSEGRVLHFCSRFPLGLVAAGFSGRCSGCCQAPLGWGRAISSTCLASCLGPSRPPGQGVTVLVPRSHETSGGGKHRCVWSVCLVTGPPEPENRSRANKYVPSSVTGCSSYTADRVSGLRAGLPATPSSTHLRGKGDSAH